MNDVLPGVLILVVAVAIILLIAVYVARKQIHKPLPHKVKQHSLPTKTTGRAAQQAASKRVEPTPTLKHPQATPKPINPADERERELYQNLLRKALGDKAKVERLIQLEGKKVPQATRLELLQNAIDRWEHDNR